MGTAGGSRPVEVSAGVLFRPSYPRSMRGDRKLWGHKGNVPFRFSFGHDWPRERPGTCSVGVWGPRAERPLRDGSRDKLPFCWQSYAAFRIFVAQLTRGRKRPTSSNPTGDLIIHLANSEDEGDRPFVGSTSGHHATTGRRLLNFRRKLDKSSWRHAADPAMRIAQFRSRDVRSVNPKTSRFRCAYPARTPAPVYASGPLLSLLAREAFAGHGDIFLSAYFGSTIRTDPSPNCQPAAIHPPERRCRAGSGGDNAMSSV